MFSGPWFKWSFFESIVGGAILAIGTWYIHRGFLLANFPQIAADLNPQGNGLFFRLTMLSLASLVAATTINHLFDGIIPLTIGDEKYVSKRHPAIKKFAVFVSRIFTFGPEPDPRIVSIRRYLSSPRREWFLAMIRDWTKTDDIESSSEHEMVRVHQHVVIRLKIKSEGSRLLLQQSYSDVVFAGSVFIAFFVINSNIAFKYPDPERTTVYNISSINRFLLLCSRCGLGISFSAAIAYFFQSGSYNWHALL